MITDVGFFAVKSEGEDTFHLVHFFLGQKNRGIKNFRKLTNQMFSYAREKGAKRVRTEVQIRTPRWRQLLWVFLKWGGFRIVSKTKEEYVLEYIL